MRSVAVVGGGLSTAAALAGRPRTAVVVLVSTGRSVVELQSHLGISALRRGKIRADSVEKIDAFVRAHAGLGADDGTCGPLTYRAITGHP